MNAEVISRNGGAQIPPGFVELPEFISAAGERASFRFVEFFTANIRNPNTRASYGHAVGEFCRWCEGRGLQIDTLNPVILAGYIELLEFEHGYSKPSVKQHLAAIRMMFDYLVTGGVLPMNPAYSVRGPKYSVKRGKTSVLTAEEARELFDSIETDTIKGLRDRALIGVMLFTFARISAAVSMRVEDYFQAGKRWKVRFVEKGGKFIEIDVNHHAQEYLGAYLDAAGMWEEMESPLFRTMDRSSNVSGHQLHRTDALRMVKRRAIAAGLSSSTCNHTFRATGITQYLSNGGQLKIAQEMAGHESSQTTGLYDRRDDVMSPNEVERIII